MVIGIDIGNSSVKCALLGKGRVIGGVRREALPGPGRRFWKALLEPLLAERRRDPVRGVVISSVVPRLTPAAEAAARRLTAHPPILVSARLRLPFILSVPFPDTVGADRLCCAAGAIGGRRRSVILIDAGSAVTVDLVHNEAFKGGVILPGPDLALASLSSYTEKLPNISYSRAGRRSKKGFDTTERSMALGAGFSVEGGIREAVRFLEKEAGRSLPKILTGGATRTVLDFLPRSWQRDPSLVLKGLYKIWQLNAPFSV